MNWSRYPAATRERIPSEKPAWLRGAISDVLADFKLPEGYGAAIFGSIADGLGNDASDVDILVVLPRETDFSDTRRMTAYEARRVEVFFRSAGQLRAWAGGLIDSTYPPSADDLDFFHRVAYCLPLVDAPEFRVAREAFDTVWLQRARCAAERDDAARAFQRACLAAQLARPGDAFANGKKALEHAGQYFACSRGETYRALKFLVRRMERAGADAGALATYRRLQSAHPASDCSAFLADVGALSAAFGIEYPRDPTWTLSLREGSETVVIGRHLVVSRGARSAIFVDLERTIQNTLRQPMKPAREPDLCAVQSLLHRLGMLEARSDAHVWIDERHHPALGSVTLTSTGLLPSVEPAVVDLPARAIVELGLTLLRAAFGLENAEEDAIGAIQRRDWDTAHAGLQNVILAAATVALTAELTYPVPSRHELLGLLELNPRTSALAAVATRAQAIECRAALHIPALYDLARQMRTVLPSQIVSRHFRDCHNSAVQWAKLARHVLAIWAEAHQQCEVRVDAGLQDLIRLADPTLTTGASLEWRRFLDLEAEVEKLRLAVHGEVA